jgi:phosphatidylserine decarboxylase
MTGGAPPSARAPLSWRVVLRLLGVLPQAALSRLVGRLAELPLPRFLRGAVNGGFARLAGVEPDELPRAPSDYPSLAEFFVRELRSDVRCWPPDARMPASPVDGLVGAFGRLDDGSALQAKGIRYRVADLLGDPEDGGRFRSGLFLTIYLSPRHYHRIHAPVSGCLLRARALPGRLLPVNLAATRAVADLFPRNERLAALLEAESPPVPAAGSRSTDAPMDVALIAVGAFNVGRISSTFDPAWNGPRGRGVTNAARRRSPEHRAYDPPIAVRRGDELMRFRLGSTVVLLLAFPAGPMPAFRPGLRVGAEIRLGEPLLSG